MPAFERLQLPAELIDQIAQLETASCWGDHLPHGKVADAVLARWRDVIMTRVVELSAIHDGCSVAPHTVPLDMLRAAGSPGGPRAKSAQPPIRCLRNPST